MVLLGDNLIFYHLCIPLVAITQIRTDVLAVFHLLPVDIGISAKDADLVLASPLLVRFADSLVQQRIYRGWRADRTHGIAPGFLYLFQRDILSTYVAIY